MEIKNSRSLSATWCYIHKGRKRYMKPPQSRGGKRRGGGKEEKEEEVRGKRGEGSYDKKKKDKMALTPLLHLRSVSSLFPLIPICD